VRSVPRMPSRSSAAQSRVLRPGVWPGHWIRPSEDVGWFAVWRQHGEKRLAGRRAVALAACRHVVVRALSGASYARASACSCAPVSLRAGVGGLVDPVRTVTPANRESMWGVQGGSRTTMLYLTLEWKMEV